jgi:hypothetical protein
LSDFFPFFSLFLFPFLFFFPSPPLSIRPRALPPHSLSRSAPTVDGLPSPSLPERAALSLSGAGGRLLSGDAGRRAVGSRGVGRGPSSRGSSSGRGGHSAAGAPLAPPLLRSFVSNAGAPPPRGSGAPHLLRHLRAQIRWRRVRIHRGSGLAADLAEWASSGRCAELARVARRRGSPPRTAPASTHPDVAPTSSPPPHLSLSQHPDAAVPARGSGSGSGGGAPPSLCPLSLLRPPSAFSLVGPSAG